MTLDTEKNLSYSLIEKLMLKNRNFCSSDYDECLGILSAYLPFDVHQYSQAHFGWQIPPKWDLVEGKIIYKDQVIYEVDHPLKVIGLSKAFEGTVSLDELKKHLFFDHRFDQAIPYHFRQFYRPWQRDWGFCVPKQFYKALQPGSYQIILRTQESKGYLSVAEYAHKGETPYGFTFVAHLDHPGMANDDLAGVAVGVELFKKLKKTKLSYSLILVPEIIGSEYFLSQKTEKEKKDYLGGCFLEMLGSKTPLSLQLSYEKNSFIEDRLQHTAHSQSIALNLGNYQEIICNDETVWQSHGIPMCSLSRFPYPEYHTSFDNLDIISKESLNESCLLLENTIESLENETWIEKKFTGTPCTSHPSFNLYIDPGQRAFGSYEPKNLRFFMDLFLAEKTFFSLNALAKKAKVEYSFALNYLKKWKQKGLIEIF